MINGKVNISRESLSPPELGNKPPYFSIFSQEEKYLDKIKIEQPTKEQWEEIKKDMGELISIIKILVIQAEGSKEHSPIYVDDFCLY